MSASFSRATSAPYSSRPSRPRRLPIPSNEEPVACATRSVPMSKPLVKEVRSLSLAMSAASSAASLALVTLSSAVLLSRAKSIRRRSPTPIASSRFAACANSSLVAPRGASTSRVLPSRNVRVCNAMRLSYERRAATISLGFIVDGFAGAEGEIKPPSDSSNASSLDSSSAIPNAAASAAACAFSSLS